MSNTLDAIAAPSFTADEELADALQRVHVDLIELHVQGKQAHWNAVGKNFRDLHLQLDELVEAARGFSDDVAERMRAIYFTPDGRVGYRRGGHESAAVPGG